MVAPLYAVVADVKAMVSRDATSRPGTAGSLSDLQIEEAIRSAGKKIDARLGALYVVPFAVPYPGLVVEICEAMAAFDLDLTFREVRDYSSELNPIYLRNKEAQELLTQLQKGTATLPDYVTPIPDPGIPDNPNDGGSIVGVINPDLLAVDLGRSRRWHNYWDGSRW